MVTARAGGVSLVEVLLAVLVLAVAGVAVASLTSQGAGLSQRASELELATVVGARLTDRLLSSGYAGLARLAATSGPLDLAALREPSDPPSPAPGAQAVDRIVYRAAYSVAERAPGLLALRVTVTFEHAGAPPGTPAGVLSLLRYVADPDVAMNSREAFPR